MKMRKLLIIGLLVMLLLPGCFRQKKINPMDLTQFYQKADLSTEQIYQRFVAKNQSGQIVSLFIKCSECTPARQDSLRALGIQIHSLSENILTARIPANALPAVAELPFVLAIENARAGKLK